MRAVKLLPHFFVIGLLLALAGSLGLGLAQGPELPEGEVQPQGEVSIAATVGSKFSYQGVLKEDGSPVTDSRDMTFRLYSDDTCSTQVGSDIAKPGVQVTDGLFSVELDVTHSDFNGQGLWLEVEVGGTKIGCQEILPVPYALSLRPGAVISGSLGAVLTIDNSSTADSAAAVLGRIAPTSPGGYSAGVRGVNNGTGGNGIGVWGSQDGGGWGVYGQVDGDGRGVYGRAGGANGVGVYARGSGSTGTALKLANGGIKVSGAGLGTSTPVFIHQATAGNIAADCGHCTRIDHPLTNGDPNAILIVTQNWNPGGSGGTYNARPIGVYYHNVAGRWQIFNQDRVAMPVDAAFNVLVVKP